MKKIKRHSFHVSLDEELKIKFEKFCDEKLINKSRLVEWLLIQYIEKEENIK